MYVVLIGYRWCCDWTSPSLSFETIKISPEHPSIDFKKTKDPAAPTRSSTTIPPSKRKNVQCADQGLVEVQDINNTSSISSNATIPMVLYQTSKSRCVTPKIFARIKQWQQYGFQNYRFLDQDDVLQYLRRNNAEFPLLEQVLAHCRHEKGTILADLFRYLLMYNNEGATMYSDIDTVPTQALRDELLSLDDSSAFFLVDKYNLLSQYVFASTGGGRHPLFYYTLQHALDRIFISKDIGTMFPGRTTGPHALLAGFGTYMGSSNVGTADTKPVHAGVYHGDTSSVVKIVGTETKPDQYVIREALSPQEKTDEYRKMNMTFYLNELEPSNSSCMAKIFQGRPANYAR